MLQMLIAANLLSHYLDGLALVTSWLLFIIGLISFLLGLAFKAQQKDYRSFSPHRRQLARAGRFGVSADRLPPTSSGSAAATLHDPEKVPEYRFAGAAPIRNLHNAFESQGHQELMRARARQANELIERQTEARLAAGLQRGGAVSIMPTDEKLISGAYLYDSEQGTNVAVGRPRSRGTEYSDAVAPKSIPLSRANSKSSNYTVVHNLYPTKAASIHGHQEQQRDGFHLRKAVPTIVDSKYEVPVGTTAPLRTFQQSAAYAKPGHSVSTAVKRRSLALAKAARKRLSRASTSSNHRRRDGSVNQRRSSVWTSGSFARDGTTTPPSPVPSLPSMTKRRLFEQVTQERDRLQRLATQLNLKSPDASPELGQANETVMPLPDSPLPSEQSVRAAEIDRSASTRKEKRPERHHSLQSSGFDTTLSRVPRYPDDEDEAQIHGPPLPLYQATSPPGSYYHFDHHRRKPSTSSSRLDGMHRGLASSDASYYTAPGPRLVGGTRPRDDEQQHPVARSQLPIADQYASEWNR